MTITIRKSTYKTPCPRVLGKQREWRYFVPGFTMVSLNFHRCGTGNTA